MQSGCSPNRQRTEGAVREDGVGSDERTDYRFLERLAAGCDKAGRWPLPGGGRTTRRFALLAAAARRDLVVGRLVEAHADAIAIAAELSYSGVSPGQTWGVWAAGPPTSVTAKRKAGRWVLDGTKAWCSGASLLSHALVDAGTDDGQQLFAVRTGSPGVVVRPSSWTGPGMVRSDTRSVSFSGVEGEAVGVPGQYLSRPGFWMGAIGVAACWHGGSLAVATPLYARARRGSDAILLSHLGAVHAALLENAASLWASAHQLDRRPLRDHSVLALSVRDTVERNAVEIMDHVGRALGPGPLAHDGDHAGTVADLTVYIRQSHAERDRVEIGRRVSGKDTP